MIGVSTVNKFSTTKKRGKCCEKKKEKKIEYCEKNKSKNEIMSENVLEISLKKKTKRKEKT